MQELVHLVEQPVDGRLCIRLLFSPPDLKSEEGYQNQGLASQEYRADVDS